jgi:hypothetical protein
MSVSIYRLLKQKVRGIALYQKVTNALDLLLHAVGLKAA